MDKRILLVLTAALALNLIIAVTPAIAQIGPFYIIVPDVVGMTKANAEAAILAESLTVSSSYDYSETVAEGHVISQNPAAGAWVEIDSNVALVISSGLLPVYFADPDLKAAVEAKLEITDPTVDDMLGLTMLWADGSNIDNLTGLETATNLDHLYLSDNQISNLSPLAGLTNLVWLSLRDNQISDISPLAGLTSLNYLYIYDNQISDITPLDGLKNLRQLDLSNNQISGIATLAGLTNLEWLYLAGNQISYLSPLSSLTNLTLLSLHDNQISDISPLSSLTNLSHLDIYNNQVSNISPLSRLTNLESLYLNNNQISDISTLAGLTNLDSLDLGNNQISNLSPLAGLTNLFIILNIENNQVSNISPLAGLTRLNYLYLSNNQISDISPLAGFECLQNLDLDNNQISDISTLAGLTVLGELDIYLNNNPLNPDAIDIYIPQIETNGADVYYGPTAMTPNVVGMSQTDADIKITDLELGVSHNYQNSDTVPEGHVISQEPLPEKYVGVGFVMQLTVSLGPSGPPMIEVPYVVGMTESDADSEITSAGFSVRHSYEYSDTVEEGHVISQMPSIGVLFPEGAPIQLAISLGPPPPEAVEVPDVVGIGEYYANSEITSAGLKVSHSYEYSDTVPEGEVISQYPSAGTSVEEGSYVDLTVSLGPQSGGGPTVPVTPEAASLLAHWKLDETEGVIASDSSGNENHGVLSSIGVEWVEGNIDGALNFSGGDGYVTVLNSPTLNPTDAITITAWIKPTWTGNNRILQKGAWNVQYGIFAEGATSFAFPLGGVTNGNLNGLPAPIKGQWNHVAATYDGSKMRVYYDGELVGEQTASGKIITGAEPLYIGTLRPLAPVGDEYHGAIDDIRIYDSALSGNQIQMIMNPPIPGLVGHWKLDETYGTIAYDSVANNDGILYGNPDWQPNGGILDGALEFDGIDDYVEIPRIVQDDFTLAAWIKTDTVGFNLGNQSFEGSGLIWSDVGGSANDFILAVLGTKLSFFCGNPDTTLNSDTDIVMGEWVHVAATRNAHDGQIGIYINGQHEKTTNHSNHGPLDALSTIAIGGNILDSLYYTGLIDDVRFYDRALSSSEICVVLGVNENLLVNGGFEDGVVSPWTAYGGVTAEVVGSLQNAAVPEAPIEGGSCLHVAVPTVSTNYRERSMLYDGLLFEKGKKYTLSAFLKCSQGMLPMSISLELGQSPWTEYAAQFVATTDQWAEYNITTDVMTEDVSQGQITFYIGYMPGEFWLDGVRFYEGDYVPSDL